MLKTETLLKALEQFHSTTQLAFKQHHEREMYDQNAHNLQNNGNAVPSSIVTFTETFFKGLALLKEV